MRAGAAADAEIPHAEVEGGRGELAEFGTGAGEGIERGREGLGPAAGGIAQGLHRGLRLVSPVGHREGRDRTRHGLANRGQPRQEPALCTAKVTTAGRPAGRMACRASSASPAQLKVSSMTKSTSASAAQLTCSSNADRTVRSADAPGS